MNSDRLAVGCGRLLFFLWLIATVLVSAALLLVPLWLLLSWLLAR